MRRGVSYRVVSLILAPALTVASASLVHGHSQTVDPWITAAERTRLVDALAAKLPQGWTLTPVGLGSVPNEWSSLDSRTFEVTGRNASQSFRVWFLPLDWIGIRQPDPRRTRTVYWEGVLMDRRYKTITLSDLEPIHEAVHATGMNTTSLVNSGWAEGMALFKDRLDDIDRHTQELVKRFCTTAACVDEAAYSLILLGVPARTLTLHCAERAAPGAQGFCAGALGYWGGPESVRVLSAVVSSPVTTPTVRRYAAFSLGQCADPSSGPALLRALQLTSVRDQDAATGIARALGRLRYAPAGPELLAHLAGERERFAQMWYVRALADARYVPAIPAIEKLCETTAISSDWMIANSRHGDQHKLPELALLRIKGPWGPTADGIRLLILPPELPTLPGPIQIAALIENAGDKNLETQPGSSMGFLNKAGTWIVDGKEYPNVDQPMWDGNMALHVNQVNVRPVNLASVLTPGTHVVQYRLLTAISNQLTVQVR